ncbi:unnamed protein product [Euphydryas editha]|uniref:Uncharacterized protein n=1 Tax=Euphydryas editha TaxID=104508 RepID=A0AAU9TQ46_EUPED|nr:unnamed protein product [Euphydryas editha]
MFGFARDKGILIKPCPAYTHELNGTAERFNRSIINTARCLMVEAKVDRRYWPEVVKAAAYLKNRTLTNTMNTLRIYGSKVFVIPEEKRNSKWDRKAELGILL